jgi:putative transposase
MVTIMPQSLSLIIIHMIFSRKDRFPCLDSATRPHLHAYLATVARNLNCESYRVGGTAEMIKQAAARIALLNNQAA